MSLWYSSFLLIAGLFMSSSALTTQECQALVTPHTTFKPMYGRWTLIMAYSDNPVFDALFRSTKSMWIDFRSTTPQKANEMIEDIGIRHGPTECKHASSPVTILGNSAVTTKSGFTCHYHSLPTCRNCLLYHVTSFNNYNLLPPVGTPTTIQQLKGYEAFYLMSTSPVVSPAVIAQAKKQAECLGFTGEPTFMYDSKQTFCEEI